MAQITKYEAGQQLDPDRGGMPQPRASTAMADAVQRLGPAIGNFADLSEQFNQKKRQKEDFKAASDYRKLNATLGEDMLKGLETIQPDGTGFHDDYMSKVYNPARDKFLQGLPNDELREKYSYMLGNDGEATTDWSIKAARTERDQTYKWYQQEIGVGQEALATGIARDPTAYDEFLKQGFAEIDASGLPTAMKQEQKASWERMAQIAHLNRMIELDPEGVLKELDADARYLSPTTQFEMLRKSLIVQESGGDASAVSPKGAIGVMQVMPDTADEIAREINDKDFNPRWTDDQKTRYLSNPVLNQRYGDHYLKKQIRTFASRGGLEAALIAYNGGPSRAEAWIKSGFDDSVIPKESADYYKKIMARLPGVGHHNAQPGSAKSVQIEFRSPGDNIETSQDLQQRVKSSFGALGIDRVKVNSGHRTEAENRKAGGAKGSQHLHGNALDIDVSGYTTAERVQIIEMLSSNGVTGLGIGSNIIHADLGGRRAWGYATSAGGGEVPKWAKAAIDKHLAGKSVPPTRGGNGGSGRYASLPYSDRQKFIADASQAVTSRYNQVSSQNAVAKVELQRSMENELASLRNTGQSTGLDETQVATVLGEDDYIKYVDKKALATRTFAAKTGINRMTSEEMNERLLDYEPVPGSPTYDADVQVRAAVEKEVARVAAMRANKPDKAAMEYPDVQEAYGKVAGAMESNSPVNPEDAQAFVQTMLDRQKEFNLKPGSEAPVPQEWALAIGKSLAARVPEQSAGTSMKEVTAAITVQYLALEEIFGEYTDEVILYSLSEYHGMGPNSAAVTKAYMEGIAKGGDPLKLRNPRRADQAYDMDQIEGVSDDGWWSGVKKSMSDFWYGENSDEGDIDPGPPEPDSPPTTETLLRVVGYLNGATEEEEAALVEQYGQSVVDAAKRKIEAGASE